MYLANDGVGWPAALLQNSLSKYPLTAELAKRTKCGESEYTEYDRNITAVAINWIRRNVTKSQSITLGTFRIFLQPALSIDCT